MPLCGREAERKDLGALIDGPEDRSGILIQGSARIGKTALVDEAAAAPHDTCPEAPSAPGVQAIAEWVRPPRRRTGLAVAVGRVGDVARPGTGRARTHRLTAPPAPCSVDVATW
ncbi:hypothetical protein [Nocardia asiatica]|uniref:hypothetical protein n=1 Tax=Nocardia asiatica TaxID=209252 RepID=UPI002455F14B|nr:hypothetical protein [Nocardia asiatica]